MYSTSSLQSVWHHIHGCLHQKWQCKVQFDQYVTTNIEVLFPYMVSLYNVVATGCNQSFYKSQQGGNSQLQSSCNQLRSSPVASLSEKLQLDFKTLFKNPFVMPNEVQKSGHARQPTAKVHARTENSPWSKKSTKLREHKVHKRSPKRSHKKWKWDVLTDDSLCSVTSDDQSEEEGNGRISEYTLMKPHLKAKHSRPIDTQSISSLGMAAHETDEFVVAEHDEEIVEVASFVRFKVKAQSRQKSRRLQ